MPLLLKNGVKRNSATNEKRRKDDEDGEIFGIRGIGAGSASGGGNVTVQRSKYDEFYHCIR